MNTPTLLAMTIAFTAALAPDSLPGAPLTITVTKPDAPQADGFRMGSDTRPDGATISLNSQNLLRDGRPWMPVMGEFHYSRYPEAEWRDELLKMKAGGIDIVATYVFWIHHEEVEDQWDWSGRRSLRRFIETCHEVGLLAAVRCGPWCHGEVRNGGIPDWALAKGWKVRTDDPAYLAHVRTIYGQIAEQLRGLLWRDGGPVIAIQLENEYGGPAEHLLALKRIARDAGLDVPLYTRTGWPLLRTPMPFGEIAPLFGAYAEGFWDRELTSMPGKYWTAFHFSRVRTDAAIATEQLGEREAQDEADAMRYPYLTCELGGGMISSYHRRIAIEPADIEAVALTKIGSGGNLPGYYMYHGGTNPAGRLTTLMEAQDTPMTNWNDMPVRSYDFYAPLGEYGQVRPHYHLLRRLHLLARDFGGMIAPMPAYLPDARPGGRDDLGTLRWSVRSDGTGGFLFVNNHQRGVSLPAHAGIQFSVRTDAGDLVMPDRPVTVPAGARFVWPFNLDLGHGVRLVHATAQPLCFIDDGDQRTVFLAATAGVPAELHALNGSGERISRIVEPSRSMALTVEGNSGTVRFVVLSEADSLALWKGHWSGRERVVLSPAAVVFEDASLRLTSTHASDLRAAVYPPISSADDGLFQELHPARLPGAQQLAVETTLMRAAGPARTVPLGPIAKPVAAAPRDEDFSAAATWRIRLPAGLDLTKNPTLRLRYRGDVARLLIGDRFITDDFYNGRPLEVGLQRHAGELAQSGGELRLLVLPLRRDAPVYLAPETWPQPAGAPPVADLVAAELIPTYTIELTPRP
ncbi:MAG: beta-galactosidase [Opitutaceae bacterium]|nr:beta-galactosidase [Opitutaceae bacterium]